MPRLLYLDSARDDLRHIQRHLTGVSASREVGTAFVRVLHQQCAKLASLPGTLGRARPELRPDIRSFPFKGYLIFFRYAADRLEIVNILEGHRDIGAYYRDDEP